MVKLPFGGTGYNLFNPAAVGFASVALCWPELVYRYPAVLRTLSVFGENAEKAATSPAHSLAIGAVPEYDVLDLLLGSAPGPMGATNILVIVACGVFLIVRKAVNWRTPVFFLLTYIPDFVFRFLRMCFFDNYTYSNLFFKLYACIS